MESVIPVFQVKTLQDVLDFYQALGFAVTYRQEKPYIYAAVQRGRINIHFTKGSTGASCVVHVLNVAEYHRDFADGLRTAYGKVPTAGVPRITRSQQGQTRFTLYDPAGNMILFINHDEPDPDYDAYDDSLSPLLQALETARFLRDTYHDDQGAARLLDKKLNQYADAPPIERARVLAARAELAVATGRFDEAKALRAALAQIPLSDEERQLYQSELQMAETTEHWLTDDDKT
ncbi:MAG: hypothetical protein SF029_03445 [bacterium]|nr:hypothetical protein [bacterium]